MASCLYGTDGALIWCRHDAQECIRNMCSHMGTHALKKKKRYNDFKCSCSISPPLKICIILEKNYIDIGFGGKKERKKGSICSMFFSKHK
jgi:hypothetical protein